MEDLFNAIVDLVKDNTLDTKDTCVKFSEHGYKAFNFDKRHFHKIKGTDFKGKIAFIDGGNAEIIKSANISLNLLRVYHCIYSKNKKVNSMKKDFYTFTHAKEKNGEIFYETEIISPSDKIIPDKADLFISSLDETIKQGITRANISNVVNIVRRFSELKMALMAIDNLEKGDIIVLDGSLQCTYTNESKYLDELYKKANDKGIIVSGISKTTTLMTDKGNSVGNALNKYRVSGKWCYHPVADIKNNKHKAELSFVKLHGKSKYIFRFEIYKEQHKHLNEAVSFLSNNCKDPVFIGYPYGLVDADKNARVSNNEKNMMKTYISVKFGKDWEKIKESVSSTDAHEVLDKIS